MFGENALLLAVHAPGATDRYGDTTAEGAPVWEGRAPCVLKKVDKRVVSGGNVTPVEMDVLFVRRVHGAPAPTAGEQGKGQTVIVEDRRSTPPVTKSFRAIAIEDRAGGLAVDSWRAELADERPVA